MKLFYSTTLAIALSAFGNTTAYAQETYPNRPITLIVPYSPGGATDIRSRQLAVKLGELLNANIVVENRAGGNGNIGTAAIARARPDGYTIGIGNLAPMAVNQCLFKGEMSFDPEQDLEPVVLLEHGAPALAVNSKSPYKSVEQLVTAAKSADGKFNFGSSGSGAASHLLSVLFQQNAGFTAAHIPYKGGSQALLGLMSQDVDFQIETSV